MLHFQGEDVWAHYGGLKKDLMSGEKNTQILMFMKEVVRFLIKTLLLNCLFLILLKKSIIQPGLLPDLVTSINHWCRQEA